MIHQNGHLNADIPGHHIERTYMKMWMCVIIPITAMLKYDIIAKPGADISKIALKYDGVDKLQVKNRELVVNTSLGELRESYPYTYQSSVKDKIEINCKYVVKNNIVRFQVKDYDPSATLGY